MVMQFLADMETTVLPYLPYLPDLPLGNFYLFPQKALLKERCFSSADEAIKAAIAMLKKMVADGLIPKLFQRTILALAKVCD